MLQRTTRFERGWNWVGAVVHWMYPTVLRKNPWAWDHTVWWLALGGIVMWMLLHFTRMMRVLQRAAKLLGIADFTDYDRYAPLTAGDDAVSWVERFHPESLEVLDRSDDLKSAVLRGERDEALAHSSGGARDCGQCDYDERRDTRHDRHGE